MADYFEDQLLECQWRGKGFPCSSFRVRLAQTVVQHRFPERDVARLEATGREPLVFSATIPFRNGISAGKSESWGALYPSGHRTFLADMADRTSGILQHPSLGLILCKPVSADSSLESGKRDGEDVSAEWMETLDEDNVLNDIFGQSSPIAEAVINAVDLDTQLDNLGYGQYDPDNDTMSFEDSIRKVQSVFDKASLLSRQQFGVIDRVIYRLDNLKRSVVKLGDPQNWSVKAAIDKLRSSVVLVKTQALKAQRDVSIYIVPAPSTFASLAARLKNQVGDLIRLNPQLLSTPELQPRTVVRYFVTKSL